MKLIPKFLILALFGLTLNLPVQADPADPATVNAAFANPEIAGRVREFEHRLHGNYYNAEEAMDGFSKISPHRVISSSLLVLRVRSEDRRTIRSVIAHVSRENGAITAVKLVTLGTD